MDFFPKNVRQNNLKHYGMKVVTPIFADKNGRPTCELNPKQK